jgi:DNA topoisomerase-2
VNKELIHFSKYDCERSIPNLMDGLKTSLRKILYCAFKRNLTSEIKVAQFGGYVSEHSGYHHGEASLMKAIVGMAQEYVGSNNINLLMPNGQFGTRLQGGDDSASERYIFTQLNDITRSIYIDDDKDVLNYLDDDGTLVEPEFYVPIIPMILVNGSKGIGTGFSTDIMCYNPKQIISYMQEKLKTGKSDIIIEPYYEGFTGDIIKLSDSKYMFKGKYEVIKKDTIEITELPVGTWTDNYKVFLEKLIDTDKVGKDGKKKKTKQVIKDYKDMSTDTKVNIIVTFATGMLEQYEKKQKDEHTNGVEDVLNLTSTNTNTNMHMFDENQRLRKYNTIYDIIDNFMNVRATYYIKRKEHQLEKLQRLVTLLSNKARFIQLQCDDVIDLRRKKKDAVVEMLKSHDFDCIDDDDEYKYLRSMPIDSVIEENITKLLNERNDKKKEYDTLFSTSTTDIWTNELNQLTDKYQKYRFNRNVRQTGSTVKKLKKVKKINKKISLKK